MTSRRTPNTGWRTAVCAALLCGLLLSACGMRGALYLPPPEASPDAEKPKEE